MSQNSHRPLDITLPEGWTWEIVEARRAKWDIGADMVPIANAPGCTAWGTINSVRIDRAIAAYEVDCKARPLYHDGMTRKRWHDLGSIERESWLRNPTPRW